MRSLRKETGGYALAYVLIVILVLCAIAMTICTIALRNYQGQVRAVAQTQQLYQAEGEIEKFVARAEDVSALNESQLADYATYVESLGDGNDSLTVTHDNGDVFTVTYQSGSIQIKANIAITLNAEGTAASHTYKSYTINRSAEQGGEGHQTE